MRVGAFDCVGCRAFLSSPFFSLTNLHRQHRNGSAVDAFNWKSNAIVPLPGGEDVEQREVMVGRGDRESRIAPELLVFDERRALAG